MSHCTVAREVASRARGPGLNLISLQIVLTLRVKGGGEKIREPANLE